MPLSSPRALSTRYLTVAAAAGLLGVSPQRVRTLARTGQLRAERPGTEWLLERGDVEARAAARRRRRG